MKKNRLYPFFQKHNWGNYWLRGGNGRFRKTLKQKQ